MVSEYHDDEDYNWKDLDDPFDEMRKEGVIDGIEDTINDDEDAIKKDI